MKPLRIDFAESPSVWRWSLRLPSVRFFMIFLLLALIVGGLAWSRGLKLQAEVRHAQIALTSLQDLQEKSAVAEQSQARLGAEEEALWRQAERQRALPWEAVFRAFEEAPPMRFQTFEPDLARGVVKVQAQAPDIGGAQSYLVALQANPVFVRVSLLRHEAQAEGGVSFHFEAVLTQAYRLPEQEARP